MSGTSRAVLTVGFSVSVFVASCGGDGDSVAVHTLPVSYAGNDRVAPAALDNQTLASTVHNSVIAWIPNARISAAEDTVDGPLLGERLDLCPNDPLYSGTVAAVCTGTLIAEDIVFTAAHCVGPDTCADVSAVLWQPTEADGGNDFSPSVDGVAQCLRVIGHDQELDLALVQLAGPLTDKPAQWCARSLRPDDPLTSCGASFGGAIMCDPNAEVIEGSTVRTDVALGASGGPLFDDSSILRGVLLSGSIDVEGVGPCNAEIDINQDDELWSVGELYGSGPELDAFMVEHGQLSSCPGSIERSSSCSVATTNRPFGTGGAIAAMTLGALWLGRRRK